MGNTLEQHRAAIGGNAARQLSRGWAPSTGVFKPFTTTEENGKKPKSKAKATKSLVTEVILLGFTFTLLTMACPLVQRVVGYVLFDHGSLQLAGSVDSKVMILGACSDSGTQEPLYQGCWGQKLTERGTSTYLSANIKPTMPTTTTIRMHVEVKEPDPGLQDPDNNTMTTCSLRVHKLSKGKWTTQATAERKSKMRIQDWSKQLVIGSDNKTTHSLGIDKLSQGKRVIRIHVQDTEPDPRLQDWSSFLDSDTDAKTTLDILGEHEHNQGKGLIQMTTKEKLHARQKDLSSEPLANEVGKKAKSFPRILELNKGKGLIQMTAEDMKPNLMPQDWSVLFFKNIDVDVDGDDEA